MKAALYFTYGTSETHTLNVTCSSFEYHTAKILKSLFHIKEFLCKIDKIPSTLDISLDSIVCVGSQDNTILPDFQLNYKDSNMVKLIIIHDLNVVPYLSFNCASKENIINLNWQSIIT